MRGHNPLAFQRPMWNHTGAPRREGMDSLGGGHVAVLRGGRQRSQNCTRCSGRASYREWTGHF